MKTSTYYLIVLVVILVTILASVNLSSARHDRVIQTPWQDYSGTIKI